MEEPMNRALRACTSTVGVGLALALIACASNQFGAPCPIPAKATPEQQKAALQACYGGSGEMYYPAGVLKDVDILFLIDNSSSMASKQLVLAQKIPEFIAKIESFGADYHVGIATSDVGATTVDGMLFELDPMKTFVGCNASGFSGDDGILQITPCTQRPLKAEAANACGTLCKNSKFSGPDFKTTDGSRFISKIRGVTNLPVNLVPDPNNPGQMIDTGPVEAFKCIALVGDNGCGIEGQLEGAKRALDGHSSLNNGFQRNGAVLAVIFITDEDDCSVQIKERYQNSPITRNCPTADNNASYDCFDWNYRCIARSVECDGPNPPNNAMNVAGAKTNCHERPNNYLEPIKKYHDFFLSRVQSPTQLLVSGIWTLPSVDKGGQLVVTYKAGGSNSDQLELGGGSLASCKYSGGDATFNNVYGSAQRRLSDFAASFGTSVNGVTGIVEPNALENSVCDIDHYSDALKKIADAIGRKLNAMCLPVVPKQLGGHPNCLVGDVDENNPNAFPDTLLPECSANCCDAFATASKPTVDDPSVKAACQLESSDCYCAKKNTAGACSDGGGLGWVGGVWRTTGTPPGKVLNFRCAAGGT